MLAGLHRRTTCCVWGIILLFAASAPAQIPAQTPAQTPAAGQASPAAPKRYVLHRGDTLDIRVFNIPELNEAVVIRPDGRITSLVGAEVDAAGLTPEGLADRLAALYGNSFRAPRVSVSVSGFTSQRVFVGGDVNAPGVFPLEGDTSVSTAVIRAGGAKDSAGLNQVTLLRGSEHRVIDLAAILAMQAPDVLLEPGDTVYVPRAAINVYVGGEVTQPGLEIVQGNVSALTAIIKAGGALRTGNLDNVLLIRNEGGLGRPMVRVIDLRTTLKGQVPDLTLQPFDVIYVPRTRIAKIDQFVDQYLRQITPIPLNAGFSYLLNNGVQNGVVVQ